MEFGPILRSMRRNKVRYGLIVAEVALTLAVVANCVNMIRDARRQMAIVSGFDDDNLVRVNSRPFAPAFKEDGYLDNSVKTDLAVLRALPGVKAASNTRFPVAGGGSSMETRVLGIEEPDAANQIYNADEAHARHAWLRPSRAQLHARGDGIGGPAAAAAFAPRGRAAPTVCRSIRPPRTSSSARRSATLFPDLAGARQTPRGHRRRPVPRRRSDRPLL
jgi:hypothetical protein